MSSSPSSIRSNLFSGFFGFWVLNYRIGILVILLTLFIGINSLMTIPKESMPDIKFGIVSVMTQYTGVSPEEMDTLITSKIEKAVRKIKGVDKVEASSRLGMSSVMITLKTDAVTDKVVQDIKDEVKKTDIPTDASEPVVTEISSQSQTLFSVIVTNTSPTVSHDAMMRVAHDIQSHFEGKYNIESVAISGGSGTESSSMGSVGVTGAGDSTLEVIVHGEKLRALGLSVQNIADIIRSYNQSFPLGNFTIATKQYDLRIEGDISSFSGLLTLPISLSDGGSVPLGQFATVVRKWKNTAINTANVGDEIGAPFVRLNFNKELGKSVFDTAGIVRDELAKFQSILGSDWHLTYGMDLADVIISDYWDLANNAWQTIILVYVFIFFFVGMRESLIASLSIPLAFLVSILTLQKLGMSLNFMTNFSLILSFGIAIDLALVIIEEASKNIKLGYDPGTAILLSVREMKLSVISSTAITLVVFVPMMMLPGIIGKFLSNIPITVFASLVATLFFAMTTNSSLFIKLVKRRNHFVRQPIIEAHMDEEDLILLAEERRGKEERPPESESWREKRIEKTENAYEKSLKWSLATRARRLLFIWVPILLTIGSLVVLGPRLSGGGIFPADESDYIYMNILSSPGSKQADLLSKLTVEDTTLEERFANIPEIKFITFNITDEQVAIFVELVSKDIRASKHWRTSAQMEQALSQIVAPVLHEGLYLDAKSQQHGPPTGKPVGIKLIANTTDELPLLKKVSKDFEAYIRSIEWVKNVTNSSADSPGEITFHVDRERAALVGISPILIYQTISAEGRGVKAGSITVGDEDIDIVVKTDAQYDQLAIDKILGLQVNSAKWPIAIGSLISYQIGNAIVEVHRSDGDLTISVEADARTGYVGGKLQDQLKAFAKTYAFPDGITSKASGEYESNQELISGAFSALGFSLLLVFIILVLVFNSYSQPMIILYTVFLGLLGVNIGLGFMHIFIDSLGYNMPMAIGFISLNGLNVTNAIILVDKLNRNREAKMKPDDLILEGSKSRLLPQVTTALTTVFGLLPTAFQDTFWANLSWTVIWGTVIATILILYCIPALYYEVYLRKIELRTKH